jgi:AcrR family transcriptional regulator
MEPDRKTLIADAAIALLGSVGARGLTHRAVDAEAGLPAGSTSFYCRSRLDLLRLALRRHATLDLADLEADALRVTQATWTRADLLALVAHRVREWLAPAQRARLVARFELEPELAEIVRELRAQFLLATQAALVRAGVSQPEARARLLAQFVDGHLLDCVGADQARPLDEVQLGLLERVLAD